MNTSISDFVNAEPLNLASCPGWPKSAVHQFDRQQAIAILAAKAVCRPLLVCGEPGCGKTQLARAAAQFLQMPLACLVVNERTEAEDLFWRYDALRRLSDANSSTGVKEEVAYLSAGPLWWALNPESAAEYNVYHSAEPYRGEPEGVIRDYKNGVLLLIDEIDKADRSVPNSLLEALGNYSFEVPYIQDSQKKRIECDAEKQPPPLIIITSNNEQTLPPAFLRRCLLLDMKLDDRDEASFVQQLVERGKAHIKNRFKNGNESEIISEFENKEIYRAGGIDLRKV
ncbi:MAG: MoxR family ATPase [Gammaproteobacteria bacterium]